MTNPGEVRTTEVDGKKVNPFQVNDRVKHLYGEFGTVRYVATGPEDRARVLVEWDSVHAKLASYQHFSNLYFAGDTLKAAGCPTMRELTDLVTRPKHYQRGGIETIDYIKATLGSEGAISYMIGNGLKYLSRFKDKDGVQDLKKARQYLDWAIAEMENNNVS